MLSFAAFLPVINVANVARNLNQVAASARRYFTVTSAGRRALRNSRRILLGLWDGLESKLGAS